MALGRFFKWVKNGIKNVASKTVDGLKKAGKWTYNNVLKPVGTTIIKGAAPIGAAIGSIIPGVGTAAGAAAGQAINTVARGLNIV